MTLKIHNLHFSYGDADLFRRIVKERQQDPEASKRMGGLFREKFFKTLTMPEDELFSIADVPATFPEHAPIVDPDACAVCGEEFMGKKKAQDTGQPTCVSDR